MITGAAKFSEWGPFVAAFLGLAGVAITLLVNGDRAERQRRRELHARALAAVIAYYEMPFEIRRRRSEAEHRSAERVRLTERFSAVQKELATCSALIHAEGNRDLIDSFDRLVVCLRATAGQEAAKAWEAEPIVDDSQVGMRDLHERLSPIREEQQRFVSSMEKATRPWWRSADEAW